jgi:hypothetical protein
MAVLAAGFLAPNGSFVAVLIAYAVIIGVSYL